MMMVIIIIIIIIILSSGFARQFHYTVRGYVSQTGPVRAQYIDHKNKI